jgi:C-methyltransferase C-terminal domain/Putative zinc binding domain
MSALRCRFCRAEDGDLVLDLGLQPACEYFPPLAADPTADPVFPLRLWLCADCGLAQLADDAELPDEPEGIEPAALTRQRHDAVLAAAGVGLLPAGATVAEGSTPHGGSWRAELEALGLRWARDGEPADIVVDASFGMMHAPDQAHALDSLVARMTPDGTLLFGFHSLAAILREQQWNAVRLGHYAYYSVPVLVRMLGERGLTVTHAFEFPLYGGTVLLAASRGGEPDGSVEKIIEAELGVGVLEPAALATLQAQVDSSITALRRLATAAADSGAALYGYSAASRAVSLIYLAGIGAELLRGVADASPGKQGCRMPGTAIPVFAPADLVKVRPDVVLLFVSDLMAEVRRTLPEIEASGGRWVDAGSGTPS